LTDAVEVVGDGGDLPLNEDEDDINWLAVSRNEVFCFRSIAGDVVSSLVDEELIVEIQVEFVDDREKTEGVEGSSLLLRREYVDAAMLDDEEVIRRRDIGLLSEVSFPSLILGNDC